jgi:hypothetical protein
MELCDNFSSLRIRTPKQHCELYFCHNIKNWSSWNETFPCMVFLNMACSTTLQTCPGALTNLIKSSLTLQASQTPASKLQYRSNPHHTPFHFANHLATSHNNATIVPTLQDKQKFGSKERTNRTPLIGEGRSGSVRFGWHGIQKWCDFSPLNVVSTCRMGKTRCFEHMQRGLLKRLVSA